MKGVKDLTETQLKKFFQKEKIEISEIDKFHGRDFAVVVLENANDLKKAIALSGSECKGSEIVIREDAKGKKEKPQANKFESKYFEF